MTPPDRKETEVRRMLEGPYPPVPADLVARAVARGERLLVRRRVALAALCLLLAVGLAALLVWALRAHPWEVPADTTPPVDTW
ncbi:hypothetical protein [Streptomyces sp. TP-A0874]|uniref:hypothetical protein n=1 Tax=Streptomyces sp. TP-A0874 TaxID=549819 RepID=UPI0008537196|nr:hypothetical protein [Streptomyces sp. TP-A0874]